MDNPSKKRPSAEEVAIRLLEEKNELHPDIFDVNGIMHEELREKILSKLDFFIEKTIRTVPGLGLEDIILNGSLATYLYHEHSDLDVKIMAKNEGNLLLSPSGPQLAGFLNVLGKTFFHNGIRFRVNQRPMDVKLSCMGMEFMGQYSILHNKWLVPPQKGMTKNFTVEEIMAAYYRKLDEMNKFMAQFERIDGRYLFEDCKKMQEYYLNLIIGYTPDMVKEYLVFKILSSQKKIRAFGSKAAINMCLALSN